MRIDYGISRQNKAEQQDKDSCQQKDTMRFIGHIYRVDGIRQLL